MVRVAALALCSAGVVAGMRARPHTPLASARLLLVRLCVGFTLAGFAPTMLPQHASRVAHSRVWMMCDAAEAEGPAPEEEKSVLDSMSALPAELLEKIKGSFGRLRFHQGRREDVKRGAEERRRRRGGGGRVSAIYKRFGGEVLSGYTNLYWAAAWRSCLASMAWIVASRCPGVLLCVVGSLCVP